MPRYNDSIEEQTAKKIHDSVWREGGVYVFLFNNGTFHLRTKEDHAQSLITRRGSTFIGYYQQPLVTVDIVDDLKHALEELHEQAV